MTRKVQRTQEQTITINKLRAKIRYYQNRVDEGKYAAVGKKQYDEVIAELSQQLEDYIKDCPVLLQTEQEKRNIMAKFKRDQYKRKREAQGKVVKPRYKAVDDKVTEHTEQDKKIAIEIIELAQQLFGTFEVKETDEQK